MNEQRIQDLKDALLDLIRQVQFGEIPATPQVMNDLADVMDHVATRIQELRREEQEEGLPPAPPEQPPQEPFQGQPGPTVPPVQGLGPPPPPEAQLLWILAGQQEDYFTQYLGNYPSPVTQNLLRNPSELERIIQYLHAMMPSGQPPVVDGIPHADLNSSNVYGFQYNPSNKKLRVRFQGGSVYEYDDIPPQIYKMFEQGAVPAKTSGQNQYGRWWIGKQPSLGASLNELIKMGGFNFRRLS